MRVLLLTAVFIPLLALARPHGQVSPPSPPAFVFETASVKPNPSRDGRRDANLAGGRFVMTYTTLRELITFAYPRRDGHLRYELEITGGPAWINADHFDVIAKGDGPGLGFDAANSGAGAATSSEISAVDRVRAMVRALLADRFKLTTHNELRDLPVYELRTDRSNGQLGPQLKKVDVDCVALSTSGAPASNAPCGGFRTVGPGHTLAHGVTMSMVAMFLEAPVSRNVFDRTGLQGTFDLDLQFTPDRIDRRGAEAPAADPNGVSVFTAVREQLGLKLESTKAPVDVLVIDRAEKPEPD
jgi:uncharacterized protein (TIGR03435 family)